MTLEIASALERNIRVIPVLVDGAAMPRRSELPEKLAKLSRRNGIEIDHSSFHADAGYLMTILDKTLAASPELGGVGQIEQEVVDAAPVIDYQQPISWTHPGCIVVLLDRSLQMGRAGGPRGLTLSEIAARAVNRLFLDVIERCRDAESGSIRDAFEIGLFSYGERMLASGEGVESALPRAVGERGIISIGELAANALGRRYLPVGTSGPERTASPAWVDPAHGYRGPLNAAIAVAGGHIFDWADSHPDSFPPIVVNITGGVDIDDRYEGADLREWSDRLTSIQTRYGQVLLFTVLLTPRPSNVAAFAASAKDLPVTAVELHAQSSLLPTSMIGNGTAHGHPIAAYAKGFCLDVEAPSWTATLLDMLPYGDSQ